MERTRQPLTALTVTQMDIDIGTPDNVRLCGIAQALYRTTGCYEVSVYHDDIAIWYTDELSAADEVYEVSPEMLEFIADTDSEDRPNPKPQTFGLKLASTNKQVGPRKQLSTYDHPAIHTQDEQCSVGSDQTCLDCGVDHSEPCEACHGTGFHKPNCSTQPDFDPLKLLGYCLLHEGPIDDCTCS